MERKLAAIFSTDVKGYSRLMGDDEEATIATLKAYREVITRFIEQHHGRVVDSPGDNLLAEFASAVDAVKAAVAIQQELKTRNAELDDHRKMEFRIGLNVGDVVTDEGRLYGDGVNIAARLEGLADPGGICLSGTVYDQIANKLEVFCTYQGEQSVKNIAQPVRAYRVQLEPDSEGSRRVRAGQPAFGPGAEKRPSRRWLISALAAIVVLVAVAIGAVRYGSFLFLSTQSLVSNAESLPLPDKPSIAVLPFTNMSGDPEQEYFSDGMTDTLITDLSKVSGLFVIARNSVFTYKDRAVKAEEVGRELGVRYVLETSVQKTNGRVRINTQLIDTTTGGHVWAERYDRELQDLFILQDEIVQKIVLALRVEVQEAERERVRRLPTEDLTAYEAYLRGREYWLHHTQEDNAQARQLFERALELDSQYADGYVALGSVYWQQFYMQWSPTSQTLERVGELVKQALALDDSLPNAHMLLGQVYLWRDREHEQAIAEGEKTIALDPNNADAHVLLGDTLHFVGRGEEALEMVEKAMRLNPYYPAPVLHNLNNVYWQMGRYEEAIAAEKKLLSRNPDFVFAYVGLAASYSALGREEEARAAAAEVLRLNPHFSLEVVKESWPYKDPADIERALTALRKAGLK